MFNKKIIVGLILAVLMSIAMVSAAEAASVTKEKKVVSEEKIDSGKIKCSNGSVAVFETFYNCKTKRLHMDVKVYTKNKKGKYILDDTKWKSTSLKKVNKNKLRIESSSVISSSIRISYAKTGLNVVNYYKKNKSKLLKKCLKNRV